LPAPIVNGGGDRLRKVQFSELRKPRDLDLGSGHVAYCGASLIYLQFYTPNFSEIEKTFCGQSFVWTYKRTDIPTDGHFRPPQMLLGRLEGVHLKIINACSSCS